MPQFTKKAIIDSFVKLLNQRPLNQITVKDIVEDCGVSRKTFYYYYQDTCALVEDLFLANTERILAGEVDGSSWRRCFWIWRGSSMRTGNWFCTFTILPNGTIWRNISSKARKRQP
jgi:AcrR family transcriptional regulator